MNTLWTHFRRLVMSMMLVAMTSFVLHSGALAGLHQHSPRSSDCQATASAGHVHRAASDVHQTIHNHGDGAAHHHAQAMDEVASEAQQVDAGAQGSCCASACPIAMAPLSLNAISAPMTLSLPLLPGSQRGAGTEPGHLKRPPRTISIA